MYSKKDIEKAKNTILKAVDAEQIILFGSYARGDYNKDSDIDLMVIIKEK
jgi:Nucleotidyltransferase domain.